MLSSRTLFLSVLCATLLLPLTSWATGGGGFAWEAPTQSIYDSIWFIVSIIAAAGLLFVAVAVFFSLGAAFYAIAGIVIALGIVGGHDFILGLFAVTPGVLIL